MNNLYKKYLFFIALIVGFIFIVETNRKKPIDWSPSYEVNSKSPLGLYVLNQEIDSLRLTKQKVIRKNLSTYQLLDTLIKQKTGPKNLLIIENYIDDYSSLVPNYKDFVAQGNNAFVIGNMYYDSDVLNIVNIQGHMDEQESINNDTIQVSLTNTKLSNANFTISQSSNTALFIPDSLRNKIEVLGYGIYKGQKFPNFVRAAYGKGYFYIHTDPSAFANINLLNSNNHLYVEGVLSYLKDLPTYLKTNIEDNEEQESQSMFRYILQNDSLRWAWYLFLISVVLFSLFHAKRKQRIIPIIKPLENTTVQFTRTVSNLYINYKDYEDIIHKSIIYTLEKMRRMYYIDTTVLDEKFVHLYQRKSGKSKEDIEAFVTFVERFRAYPKIANEENLIKINKIIEKIID